MDLATPCAALRMAASLAVRPGAVLRRGAGLVAELGAVGLGTSAATPRGGGDRSATLPSDPVRRRAVQAYLATTGALSGLLDDAAAPSGPLPGLGPADEARLREVLDGLTGLARPAREPGPGHARADAPDPGPPAPARYDGPVPGRDIAATPGAVVLRTPVFELLQYLPRTEQVRDVPVLVVPPLAHRYYLADLCPGHSLVESLVEDGLQVFALSWPDPEPETAGDRDLDTYAAAVVDAVQACTRVTRAARVVLAGVRTGGLLAAAVQAHLDAAGRADEVAAAVYLGTSLDRGPARPGSRLDAVAADDLPDGAARRALRHWAGDLLHVPDGLAAGLAALAGDGPRRSVLGTAVRPDRLRADGYLVTPADDPAQPWTEGHRTALLLGGRCRLVLASGDRVRALAVPDGFRAGPVPDDDTPDDWRASSPRFDGSWWPDLAAWLSARTGALREAPPELGGRRMHPVHPAPGLYLQV